MKNQHHLPTLLWLFILFFMMQPLLMSQRIAINSDGSTPDSSAMLDIKSSHGGLLIPRLTTAERTNINNPAPGLVVYDKETKSFWFYTGSDWMEVLSGFVSALSDNDADTRIEVEQTTDEDKIRFTTGGTEYLKMAGGRMEVINTGGSVFLGEGAGKNDDLTQKGNVAIGRATLEHTINTGSLVAIGDSALYQNQSFGNTAIGSRALKSNLDGVQNTAMGINALYSNTTGYLNAAYGSLSLLNNQGGNENAAYGASSLFSNTSGSNNSAIGRGALFSNTEGMTNTAVGSKALFSNTDRSHLVAVGDSALYHNGLNTSADWHGTNNTAIGSKALFNNTIGNDNTVTGYLVMYENDSGYRNSAFGKEALYSNLSGQHNNVFGNRAMYLNTEGSYNVAMGSSALYNNTSGTSNTAFGNRPLNKNTSGSANVAIGEAALFENTDRSFLVAVGDSALFHNGSFSNPNFSSGNVAVGSKAMFTNTEGYFSTATGYHALYSNTTGNSNTAIGYEAMYANETGHSNTAIGRGAMRGSVSAHSNTAVGWLSLQSNISGASNSVLGYRALYSNTYGYTNTVIGRESAYANTIGAKNTSLGYQSNYQNIEGNNNTILGYQAGYGLAQHSKSGNIFIGYRAGYDEINDNRLYIHNDSTNSPLIYGEFDQNLLRINGNLEVKGDINVKDSGTVTPQQGTIRWNDTTQDFEGYTGFAWKSLTSQNTWKGVDEIHEEANLQSSDLAAGDLFGQSVSISGDYAIIGAQNNDDNGSGSGSAYIYTRSNSSWKQQAKLTAEDAAAGDNFGNSVSISGNYAIVGAWFDDHGLSDGGSAYIFVRSDTTWSQQYKLTPSDASADKWFGNSVCISGDYAIVGAFRDDHAGAYSGSAYIFKRTDTIWLQQAKLTLIGAAANDYFGKSVSITNSFAVVGADGDDDAGSNAGTAHIFNRSGTNWSLGTTLTASDATSGDNFGSSVSISSDAGGNHYVAIGARYAPSDISLSSGAVYVFFKPVGAFPWSEQEKITSSDTHASQKFGGSVSMKGDYLIVGANGDNHAGFDSGAAYVFRRSGTSWMENAKLTGISTTSGDQFGYSVGIFGDYAIVGAREANVVGSHSGSAYIFK